MYVGTQVILYNSSSVVQPSVCDSVSNCMALNKSVINIAPDATVHQTGTWCDSAADWHLMRQCTKLAPDVRQCIRLAPDATMHQTGTWCDCAVPDWTLDHSLSNKLTDTMSHTRNRQCRRHRGKQFTRRGRGQTEQNWPPTDLHCENRASHMMMTWHVNEQKNWKQEKAKKSNQ